jgi:hypothetical protein
MKVEIKTIATSGDDLELVEKMFMTLNNEIKNKAIEFSTKFDELSKRVENVEKENSEQPSDPWAVVDEPPAPAEEAEQEQPPAPAVEAEQEQPAAPAEEVEQVEQPAPPPDFDSL